MEFSWSALWNITDETPDNCEMFLNYSGMKLFLECLKVSVWLSLERCWQEQWRCRCLGRIPGSAPLQALFPTFNKQESKSSCKFFSHHCSQPVEQRNLQWTHLPLCPSSRAAVNSGPGFAPLLSHVPLAHFGTCQEAIADYPKILSFSRCAVQPLPTVACSQHHQSPTCV